MNKEIEKLVKTDEELLIGFLSSMEILVERRGEINKEIEFIKKQMYKLVRK